MLTYREGELSYRIRLIDTALPGNTIVQKMYLTYPDIWILHDALTSPNKRHHVKRMLNTIAGPIPNHNRKYT